MEETKAGRRRHTACGAPPRPAAAQGDGAAAGMRTSAQGGERACAAYFLLTPSAMVLPTALFVSASTQSMASITPRAVSASASSGTSSRYVSPQGEPFARHGRHGRAVALHLILVLRKVAADVPVPLRRLQRIMGLEQGDVALELRLRLPVHLDEILGRQREELLVDVGRLAARHVPHGELVADGDQLALHLVDRFAGLVHDGEGFLQGDDLLLRVSFISILLVSQNRAAQLRRAPRAAR